MKSLIGIHNLKTSKDTKMIREVMSSFEGVIACEISLSKKEVAIVYDELSVSLDEIINSIEIAGYMIK